MFAIVTIAKVRQFSLEGFLVPVLEIMDFRSGCEFQIIEYKIAENLSDCKTNISEGRSVLAPRWTFFILLTGYNNQIS